METKINEEDNTLLTISNCLKNVDKHLEISREIFKKTQITEKESPQASVRNKVLSNFNSPPKFINTLSDFSFPKKKTPVDRCKQKYFQDELGGKQKYFPEGKKTHSRSCSNVFSSSELEAYKRKRRSISEIFFKPNLSPPNVVRFQKRCFSLPLNVISMFLPHCPSVLKKLRKASIQ